MPSGRYQPPITFLSSLFIVLLLSTSAGSADEWKCPTCAQNAALGLAYLAERDQKQIQTTFCRMHYEDSNPEALTARQQERRKANCSRVIDRIREHLRDITNGSTTFINVDLIDDINRRISRSGGVVTSSSIVTKITTFPDPKNFKEYKSYSRELKQLTGASWLTLLARDYKRDCFEWGKVIFRAVVLWISCSEAACEDPEKMLSGPPYGTLFRILVVKAIQIVHPMHIVRRYAGVNFGIHQVPGCGYSIRLSRM